MDFNWPANSVVYQIYIRSFKDSNNDGVGDLAGITQKLDYFTSLGINAIWLTPVYRSPHADFGYDVADYKEIDPLYGDLATFDILVHELKKREIKLLMDFVPNHTSSENNWFKESRSSQKNDKRDWYIWADPKKDGSPPNNWLSVFGGSAWEFDPTRKQYYLHLFDKHQPDLNWHNPEVQEAMFDVLRFWMDRGVDGFRVDVPYHLFKDKMLRDEPANPNYVPGQKNFDSLLHIHTAWLPESFEMVKKFTKVLQEYKDKFMVTEAWGAMPELIKLYVSVGWKWFAPFNFSFITLPWVADLHKEFIDEYDRALGEIYIPCYVLGNHDTSRVATRIGYEQSRVAALLQFSLRGIPFIYYGEELGMADAEIPKNKIKDTFEINSPGMGFGRDPERTPMQWDDTDFAGFSKAEPWLPTTADYSNVNVATEENNPESILSLYKALIKLKKHNAILKEGAYIPLPMPDPNVYAFIREKEGNRLLILANFSSDNAIVDLDYPNAKVLCHSALTIPAGETLDLKNLVLKGNEAFILSLSN